jgi:hypothetical protein
LPAGGAGAGASGAGAGAGVSGAGAGAGAGASGAGGGAGASSFFWQPIVSANERTITKLSIIANNLFIFLHTSFHP